jgi:hypothetical protein
MKKNLLPPFLLAAGVAAQSLAAYFVQDIAVLVFGSAVPRTERLIIFALLVLQLSLVTLLAFWIRRRHCADLRAWGRHASP